MAEVVSQQDRIHGRVICQWWQKNTIFNLVFAVCTAEHRQEGKIQILANIVALPRGGGMPLRWPKLLISMHGTGSCVQGWGEGVVPLCHCEEGGGKTDLLHRSKKLQVVWNLALFFCVTKMAGTNLWIL